MTGRTLTGILPADQKWLLMKKLDLATEVMKTLCKNSRRSWNGDENAITIACLDNPLGLVWWYTGTKCYPKAKRKRHAQVLS